MKDLKVRHLLAITAFVTLIQGVIAFVLSMHPATSRFVPYL